MVAAISTRQYSILSSMALHHMVLFGQWIVLLLVLQHGDPVQTQGELAATHDKDTNQHFPEAGAQDAQLVAPEPSIDRSGWDQQDPQIETPNENGILRGEETAVEGPGAKAAAPVQEAQRSESNSRPASPSISGTESPALQDGDASHLQDGANGAAAAESSAEEAGKEEIEGGATQQEQIEELEDKIVATPSVREPLVNA